eukprot:XP_019921642.1 PREDICTED: vacuolar protein sorting-associated protein 4B-like [Crassostrea gigas]
MTTSKFILDNPYVLYGAFRELFSQAEQEKPALIFLDDIEVFGISNLPQWFQRRIEIPLPDEDNRCEIFKTELDHAKVSLTEEQLLELGRKTSGFTGSDIVSVVRML